MRAFLLLTVLTLTAAALTQWLAGRHRIGRGIERTMLALMGATLFTVMASQAGAVGAAALQLLVLVPLYTSFLVIMVFVGKSAGQVFRLDVPTTRALVFSGVTRYSLVVLPLALALPASLALAPVVVVTQTLIELIRIVALIRLVPRLIQRGT